MVVFCDLRGFTPFAEASEPEEVMGVLAEYHEALGELIHRFEGTLERFTGDGLMVFFNDPLPIEDPAERAVLMAVAMRDRVAELAAGWSRRGNDLGFGIGIAQGFATLGRIGFEGRFDYAAIGSVTNLAARLCAEAGPSQILVAQRVFSATEGIASGEPVGELDLKGFSRPVQGIRRHGHRRDGHRRDEGGGGHMTTLQSTDAPGAVTTLADLDDEARYVRFQRLQDRMESVWNSTKADLDDESVVVVPSVTISRAVAGSGSGSMTQAFEERFLFLLLLLRQPRLRMVYVTSTPVDPRIIEYYLALLPGVIPSHALARLSMVSVGDASPRPLSEKLLERPRLLAKIAALVPNREHSHLIPYNTTELERDIALTLGIPMYGSDPRLSPARHQDRLPEALRRGRRASTRSAPRTCTASTRSSTRSGTCWRPGRPCARSS